MRSFLGSILAVLRNNEISQLSTSFGMVVARPVRAGRATIASGVLVSGFPVSDGPTKLGKRLPSQMSDPFPSTRSNRERRQERNA